MTNYLNSCKVSAIEAFLPPITDKGSNKPASPFASLTVILKTWRLRARQRHALAELNDHQLADIGISRQTALLEAKKPFWLT